MDHPQEDEPRHPVRLTLPSLSERAGKPGWWIAFSLTVVLACFAWPAISRLVWLFIEDSKYTHGFILVLFALLGIRQTVRSDTLAHTAPSWIGLGPVVAGMAAVVLGEWYLIALNQGGTGAEFLMAMGLIAIGSGMLMMVTGPRGPVRFIVPMLFLLLAVPLPVSWYDGLTLPLRNISAALAEVCIRQLDIPVYREGNLLHLANITLGVGDVCSGLQSKWAMMAISRGWAYWREGGIARGIFRVAVGLAAARGVNLVRLILTAVMGYHLGGGYTSGRIHEAIGLVIFWVAVAGMVLLAVRLGPGNATLPSAGRQGNSWPAGWMYGSRSIAPMGVVLMALFAGGIAGQQAIDRHYREKPAPPEETFKPLELFPQQIGRFGQVEQLDIPMSQLAALKPTDRTVRVYAHDNGTRIRLMILFWEPFASRAWRLAAGPHDPRVCYPAAGWKKRAEYMFDPEKGPEDPGMADRLVLFEKGQRHRLLFYRLHSGLTDLLPDGYFQRIRTLFHTWNHVYRFPPRYLVSAETAVLSDMGTARASLNRFASHLAKILPAYGIHL